MIGQRVYLNLETLRQEYPFYPTRRNLVPLSMDIAESFTIATSHYDSTPFGVTWRYRFTGEKPWLWYPERELVDEEGQDWLTLRIKLGKAGGKKGVYKPHGPIPGEEEIFHNPPFQATADQGGKIKWKDEDSDGDLLVSEEEEEDIDPFERANSFLRHDATKPVEKKRTEVKKEKTTTAPKDSSEVKKKQKPEPRSPSISDLLVMAEEGLAKDL